MHRSRGGAVRCERGQGVRLVAEGAQWTAPDNCPAQGPDKFGTSGLFILTILLKMYNLLQTSDFDSRCMLFS